MKNIKKIAAISTIIILVLNLILLVIGKTTPLVFWMIIICSALVAYSFKYIKTE